MERSKTTTPGNGTESLKRKVDGGPPEVRYGYVAKDRAAQVTV